MAIQPEDPEENEEPNYGVAIPAPSCLTGGTTSWSMTSPNPSPMTRSPGAPLTLSPALARDGASQSMSSAFASAASSMSPALARDGAPLSMSTWRSVSTTWIGPKSFPRGSRDQYAAVGPDVWQLAVPGQHPQQDEPSVRQDERLLQHGPQQPGGVQFSVHVPSEFPGFPPMTGNLVQAQQHVQQALATLSAMEVDDNEYHHKEKSHAPGGHINPGQPTVAASPAPAPSVEPSARCPHTRTTKGGTNAYVDMVTCLDCHQVLSRQPKAKPMAAGDSSNKTYQDADPDCRCLNVTWKGSNAFRWKKTCLDCGKTMTGNQPHGTTSGTTASPSSPPAHQMPVAPGKRNMMEVQEILGSSLMVATVKAAERPQQCLDLGEVHKIIDVVAQTLPALPSPASPTPTSSQPPSTPVQEATLSVVRGGLPTPGTAYGNARVPTPGPGSPGDHPDNLKIMNFGKYKNKPFWYAFTDDDYVELCITTVSPNSCRGLKKFVEYINERNLARQRNLGFMGVGSDTDEEEQVGQEKDLVAILDSGCNKTCHGEEWF